MEQRDLNGTGLMSSRVVLGSMTFGGQVGPQEASSIVGTALDFGVNHFDTANSYNAGAAEEILGRALRGHRDSVLLATKVFNRYSDGPDGSGLGRKAVLRALDESLRRLGTDNVDLYYLHQPDRSVPAEETLATMAELVQAGKVRHVGCSNYSAWRMTEMLCQAEANAWPMPRTAQQLYNPLARGLEEDYVDFALSNGVTTLAYNPLAGGLLTGKHRGRDAPLPGRFQDNELYRERYWHPSLLAAADRLAAVAEEASCTLIELSFSWLLAQPVVDAVVLGVSSLDQLRADLAAAQHPPLTPEHSDAVDRVWKDLRGQWPCYSR